MKDTREVLTCPACAQKMKKVAIAAGNFYLDVCLDGCGGIYFDNRELEKLDEKTEDISEIVQVYTDKTFNPANEAIDRVCPACAHNFVKHFVSAKQEIQIDDCYNCGGKFLDYGELEKMRAQYDTEQGRIDDVVNYLYSQKGLEIAELEIQNRYNQTHRSIFSRTIKSLLGQII